MHLTINENFLGTSCSQSNYNSYHRLENENRQLREIVNQLRTARKTTQESADIALADRQSYLETIEHQKKELLTLREKLTDYNSLSEKNPQLLEEVDIIEFILVISYRLRY